jgi:Tfp pilus assembly protein PilO
MITSPAIKTVAQSPQHERNNMIEIVLLAVVIIIFSWFVLKPKVIAVAQSREELKELEQQQSIVATKKDELMSLVAKMENAKVDISLLDEALPLQPRATTLVVLVDSLAKSNGLSVTATAMDGSEIARDIAAADHAALADPFKVQRKMNPESVLVTAGGTLDQFMGFLNAIENSTRLLDVETIDISGEEDGTLSFKVKVKAYTFSS